MVATFNGVTKTITLESGITDVDIGTEIYSAWKDWIALSDNSKFLRAFAESVGGNPLTDVLNLGAYFFLNNTDGWIIKPPEEDIQIVLNGNIFGTDPLTAILGGTTGSFNTFTRTNSSSLTQTVNNSKITEIHKLHGLDSSTPLITTSTTRDAGPDISQTIVDTGPVTVTRI